MVGDPRIFGHGGPYTIVQVADAAGGTTDGNPGALLTGVAPLSTASRSEVSFLDNARYADALATTGAGAVLIHPDLIREVPLTAAIIATTTVYESWARVARLFLRLRTPNPRIHATAWIAEGTHVGPTIDIGAFASVGQGVQIGPGTSIGAHADISDGVVIGADCRIGSHVSVSHALIGNRVSLLPGARIGQEGFSFATMPRLGRVIIGDDVEIGANTTVDRGSVRDTVIGSGSHLDDLAQSGSNVRSRNGPAST